MRALVTGGAGFIGSHLCDALVGRGHAVDLLDDLSTGSRRNVAGALEHPGVTLTVGSACDPRVVDPLVDRADLIFHLAAAVGVELVVDAPVRTIETNIRATEVVLASAARRGLPLLLASTSEVYGKSAAVPFREDGDLVLGPTTSARWSYAASKALDVFLALAYAADRDLPVVVARLVQHGGSTPDRPIRNGRTEVRARRAGRRRSARPRRRPPDALFLGHVADVVRALAELATTTSAYGHVFNVGATDEITVLELARRVLEVTGSDSPIRLAPYVEAFGPGFEDMRRRRPDTTKIEESIGWRPPLGLEDILTDTVAHARPTAGRSSERLL